jgi:serine/threonine-protein kinase SRPK3
MFSGTADRHYDLRQHLAEIVHLFGPFPRALLEKGTPKIVEAMFDEEGEVMDAPPMYGPELLSEEFTPGLNDEVRWRFVSFLVKLMKIDPEERPTHKDLLRHIWLDALR